MGDIAMYNFCAYREECFCFRAVVEYVEGEELSQAIGHLRKYRHCRKKCRHGSDCYRFKRNLLGLGQFTKQKEYDEAHCLVYHHDDDMYPFENPTFSAFQSIPQPKMTGTKPLWFQAGTSKAALKKEIIRNGFLDVFKTPSGGSIEDVVATKMGHPIHISLGSPLCKKEMLAILLYTGSRIQGDMNTTHREGNFSKWPVLRNCLRQAIEKLHAPNHPCNRVKTKQRFLWRGMRKTRFAGTMPPREMEYCDFMSTSSCPWEAKKFLGENGDEGILLKLDKDQTAIWADVSWISKFPYEQEILFAPTKWKLIDGPVHTYESEDSPRNCVVAHYKLSSLPPSNIAF